MATDAPDNPPTHNWLLAFPHGLPARLTCAAGQFQLVRQFKHDFFAATGLYERQGAGEEGRRDAGTPGRRDRRVSSVEAERSSLDTRHSSLDTSPTPARVVLKIQRRRPFLGLPLAWLGGWLTRHEATIYRELADVPGVPAFVDFFGATGFIHDFVPGKPLSRDEPIPDSFFDDLADLLSAIHARGLAYVDLNKRQNILVGDDGRPHLIDFQISFRLGRRRGEMPRAVLAMLQKHDWYHFYKHKRRCRPDLMTPEEIERSYRTGGWIDIHRRASRPYFFVRRRLLDRLGLPRGDAAEG